MLAEPRSLRSSQDGCLVGQTSFAAGAVLTLDSPPNDTKTQNVTTVGLLTGTFRPSLQTFDVNGTTSANGSAFLEPFLDQADAANMTGFSVSNRGSDDNLRVTLDLSEQELLAYSAPLFAGGVQSIEGANASLKDARSLIISQDTFAVVRFGASDAHRQLVLFDSVPDTRQWALDQESRNGFELVSAQSTVCTSPCSSHGICMSDGSCQCEDGFTGDTCGRLPSSQS